VQHLRRLGARPELILGMLAVGVFVVWDAAQGGFPPTIAYPGAVFLLGLLTVTAITYRAELTNLPTPSVVALALLAAFTLWSFVSIAWADVRADAWDGANRTLLYLTVYVLFTLPRWRATTAAIVLGAYSLGVALIGVGVLIDATGTSDPAALFNDGSRLVEPIGYTNGTAALFAAAVWPAIFLASRSETPWPLRGVFLAAAGLLVQLAIVPQSRGAFIAAPIALALYLALVPNRVRSALVLLPVAAATALAAPDVLDVFTVAENGGDLGAALDRAGGAMAISALALLAIGACLGLADRRIPISSTTERTTGLGLGVAGAVAGVVGAVLLLGVIGNPVTWAEERWDDFKGGYDPQGFGSSRFSGNLGSGRYDYWRVALDEEFSGSPVAGAGAENFAVVYLRERETLEEPLYAHSLPIGVLAGLGIIGGVLFVGFVGFAVAGGMRTRLAATDPFARAVSAAALVAFAYWLVHASGDWLWAIPGLTAPALAWLAIAGRLRGDGKAGGSPPAPRSRSLPGLLVSGAALVAVVFAAISYMLPWAAARDVETAESTWRSDPDAAFERLDRARALNFLSSEPDVVEAAIAGELGEIGRVRAALEDAIEREPTNWYALLELGTLYADEGDRAAGLVRLREAAELNPHDGQIRLALRRAREGRPLSLAQLRRISLRRVCGLVGRTGETPFC
jgi:hypothetical protein